MRACIALAAALVAGSHQAAAETTVQVGVGTTSFQFDFLYTDLGADARTVEREVSVLGEADLLVALHLCRVAGVELEVVAGSRRSGMSWDTITRRCHRNATIYYVEVPAGVSGPPYGRACGYWKKHPHGDLVLRDDEIREFVLARSLAAHCGVSAAEIVSRRSRGESARSIAGRHADRGREDTSPPPARGKGHGKGHGKGR